MDNQEIKGGYDVNGQIGQNDNVQAENSWERILEDQLCRKCHARSIDRSENSNSILCHTCREEQIRYPLPRKVVLIALALVAALTVAMVQTFQVLKDYRQVYQEARIQADEGDIFSALLTLDEFLEDYPDSVPVAERMVDLAMEHGYYDAAAYAVDTYFHGKSISDELYAKLTRYMDRLKPYYNTQERLELLVNEMNDNLLKITGGEEGTDLEADEEAAIRWVREFKEKLLQLTGEAEYDEALLYYYIAQFAEDQKEAREYLKKSVEIDPLLTYPQVQLGTNYRRSGDLEQARECYEQALSIDSYNPGALRVVGILEMLEGNMEQGLANIQMAYDRAPDEEYVKETLMIALTENGRFEEAQQRKDEFEAAGETFDQEFEDYLSGMISLHDYYIDEE